MNAFVCNYAVLRFLPYRETGEFINAGVVVFCPQTGFFGFRCEPRWRQRFRAFFPELDKEIYRLAVRAVREEMGRVARGFQEAPGDEQRLARKLDQFRHLTQAREGLFHFAARGVLSAPNPEDALEELYDQFVLRRFAQAKDYQETVMRKRLDEFLRQWNLRRFYKTNREVGDERFYTTFPFVYGTERHARKALKPLDLDRRDATDIYQHADTWLNAMRRLNQFGKAPEQTVFPVRLPLAGARLDAANEVARELTDYGAIVVPMDEVQPLRAAVEIPLHANEGPV